MGLLNSPGHSAPSIADRSVPPTRQTIRNLLEEVQHRPADLSVLSAICIWLSIEYLSVVDISWNQLNCWIYAGYSKKEGRYWGLYLCSPLFMVAMGGLEPPTPALWMLCSNQLSYIAPRARTITKHQCGVNAKNTLNAVFFEHKIYRSKRVRSLFLILIKSTVS